MMRRKSARNSRKSPEKSNIDNKMESSKRGSRSSRRRKRSSSKSGNESENEKTGIPDVIDSIQEQQREQIETTEEFQMNSEHNEDFTKDIVECSENLNTNLEEVLEENDEKEEDKGKSKGINNTQNEQSWNNIETENEHVQGTPQSPSKDYADTESVQNINEIQTDVTVDDSKEECTQNEETSNNEEVDFQSEYVQDSNVLVDNRDNIEQPQSNPNCEEERSTTPEIKNKREDKANEKKKIILRRITVDRAEKAKEKQPDQEPKRHNDNDEKKSSRKIILKRHTTELKMNVEQKEQTLVEDITVKRRSSANDADIPNKEKKIDTSHDGIVEDKPQETEISPKEPSMKIKLVRNFSQEQKPESQDIEESKLRRRQNWGDSTEWLGNLSTAAFQIDVESIKVVCPAVEFLKEEDVKLESDPPKERLNLDVELSRRKLTIDRDDNNGGINTSEASNSEHLMSHNRKITIINDIIVKAVSEETMDNRIPSPAKHPPSDVLFIANLVRPFTVKQLRELLERTGTIVEDGFWTDKIKSKCYVQYQTVEEAETTRNALHGVNWPVGNGKKLDIDFATVEDLEKAKNPAPIPKVVPEIVPEKENREPEKETKLKTSERDEKTASRKRDGPVREWDKGKEDMRRRSRSKSAARERVRKHSRRSYTPEIPMHQKRQKRSEEPVPQKLMDDLFLKTKATPSIYWQPLSPEEIARKQHQRLVRMEEHKRRIEENRERLRESRRGPYRRR